MSNTIFDKIVPQFRPYIQHLCRELKLGLCKTSVDVETICSNLDVPTSQFCLVLPYCSRKIRWDVIFNEAAPWFAPDFRFDDESFLGTLDASSIEKNLPSLANWNDKDPKALTQLIREMVNLYKNDMIGRLKSDEASRAYFEYSALLGHDGIEEGDIEVWVEDQSAEFLIRLNIDTSELPGIYSEGIEENPSVDSAFLLWRYPHSNNPELIFSPSLSRVMGNFPLPPMHRGGVLIDYVPLITDLINNRIQSILNNEKIKRELTAQLIVRYNGAVLEHDESSASFLFEIDDFHWILKLEMGPNFPEILPTMTLMSIYYQYQGKPRSKVLSLTSHKEMPEFESYIRQQFEIFKAECTGGASTSRYEITL